MKKKMSNRERVDAVLKGKEPDRIPFSIYEWKIPWGYDKRKLRERGLTMLQRFPGWVVEYPNCKLKTIVYVEKGVRYEREIVETPKGTISCLYRLNNPQMSSVLPQYSVSSKGIRVKQEFWIKNKDDYIPLLFMIRDSVFCPAYEEIIQANKDLGEDGYVYIFAGYSPLQEIILHLLGIEGYCYESVDHPAMIEELYDALWARDLRKYPVIAKAPVKLVEYDGNHISSVLGRDVFIGKILPCINKCAGILHEEGKLLEVHEDGDNALWAHDLSESEIDIIEAFTPAPDSDMTMAEGYQVFKNKIVWANFPSSKHLANAKEVRITTREILDAVMPSDRFLLGITEDIPQNCWRMSLSAILDVIEERS